MRFCTNEVAPFLIPPCVAAWTNFNTTLLEEYYDDMNSFPLIKVIFAMKKHCHSNPGICEINKGFFNFFIQLLQPSLTISTPAANHS